MDVRDRIKKWRKGAKKTQEEAARFLGVSISTLQKWEQGQTEPSEEMRERLGDILGVS